jgi:hypothetical protein
MVEISPASIGLHIELLFRSASDNYTFYTFFYLEQLTCENCDQYFQILTSQGVFVFFQKKKLKTFFRVAGTRSWSNAD